MSDVARWLTRQEAAQHCRLSIRTLSKLVALGRLRQHRPGGQSAGKIVFDRHELDAYLESTVEAPK